MNQAFSRFSNRFNNILPKATTTFAEYIWVGGNGIDLRGKTMCLPEKCTKLSDFPTWGFDGSSTEQAVTEKSEIFLKPVQIYPDPLRSPNGERNAYIVLCETFESDEKTPARANFRHYAKKVFDEVKDEKPWFGWEQEYIFLANEGAHLKWPLGFPKSGFAYPQGQYYCSIGSTNSFGREIAEAHMNVCLAAGLQLSGINAEVFPGQWEFQIGPGQGLEGCDELWIARYFLQRICEEFGVEASFEPKPVKGQWNGSGCHCNVSTTSTRAENGLDKIIEAIQKFEKKHQDHIFVYGEDNHERLTGFHETAAIDKFSYRVGSRATSIRIGNKTYRDRKGYFEDRRPASNCDPYLVGGMILDTMILNGKYGSEIVEAYKQYKHGFNSH